MAKTSLGPPVAGAYICPVVTIDANATTSTATHAELDLPAGMTAVLIGVSLHAASITSDPAVTIGTASSAAAYLGATNLTTTAARPTLAGAGTSNGRATITAGTPIVIRVTNDAGDGHGLVNVGLWMYVKDHATNVPDNAEGALAP